MENQTFIEDLVLEELASLEGLGIENLDDLGHVVERLRDVRHTIATEGMSAEHYQTVESVCPGVLASINPKHCTQVPGGTKKTLALEFIDGKLSDLIVAGAVLAGSLAFFKVIEMVGKHFQSHKFELDMDISSERFRRTISILKDTEDSAYAAIWNNYNDIKFAFDSVANRLIKVHENERAKMEIYREMKKYLDRKNNVYESVTLLLLAKFCTNYEVSAFDYSKVADRIFKFPTYSHQRALTTGLAITRSGISGKLLLKDKIGFNGNTASDLHRLASLTEQAVKLLSKPNSFGSIDRWQVEAERMRDMLAPEMFNSLSLINQTISADSTFSEDVRKLRNGRIGFWTETEVKPQGDVMIAPEQHQREINTIFSLGNIQEAVRIKDGVRAASAKFRDAVETAYKTGHKDADKFLSDNEEASATYRALTAVVRKAFSDGLRVSTLMVAYCEGYIEMIAYCKNLNRIYSSGIKNLLGIK